VSVRGRTAIVVDDGTVTGATARAACQVARKLGAARVVVAVPVGASDAVAALGTIADEVACLGRPEPFLAVGRHYEDFTPTMDAEVAALLERAGRRTPSVQVAHGSMCMSAMGPVRTGLPARQQRLVTVHAPGHDHESDGGYSATSPAGAGGG